MALKTKAEIAAERMSKYKIKPAGIKEGESLLQAHKRLAKQVDQRMRRLETLAASDPNFKGALTYSYGLASHNAVLYGSNKEKPRFDIAPPTNQKTLQAKINDMIQFLNSPTSTKGGIVKMYKARTEKLNELYGTDFTWQEAGKFFESKKDDFKEAWKSGMTLKSIGKMQANRDIIKEQIKDFTARHKVVSDNEVDEIIYQMLKDNKLQQKAALLSEDTEKATATIHDMLLKAGKIKEKKRSTKRKKSGKKK